MSTTLILTNNNQNINLIDYSINRLRNHDFIQENNIVSQTIRMETINSVQQITGTIVYNTDNLPIIINKNILINYESSIKSEQLFINGLLGFIGEFGIDTSPIAVYYNNVHYTCSKLININGIVHYFLNLVV